jgi:capsular exopolysaccharide synthesis family protein
MREPADTFTVASAAQKAAAPAQPAAAPVQPTAAAAPSAAVLAPVAPPVTAPAAPIAEVVPAPVQAPEPPLRPVPVAPVLKAVPAAPAAPEEAESRELLRHLSAVRPRPNDTLITGTQRKDAVEQYRKMAATLHHVQANRNIRVVLTTSAVMAEGKTVTAANLALTLSQSYQRRVLLIDADLRRPRLHSLFNIPNEEGLFEALRAPADRRVVTASISPYLSVVTAGRPGPDPVGVLTSERLARVVEDAGAAFDWVIIDTPPVLVLPDAGLLMGVVDAAVLVIGAGQTTYRMAKRAAETLGRDRIIGVVMNRADDSVLQDGYGQYYGYYETATGTE